VDPNSYNWAGDVAKVTGNFAPDGGFDGPPDAVIVAAFTQLDDGFTGAFISAAPKTSLGDPLRLLHFQGFRVDTSLQNLGGRAEGQEGTSHIVQESGPSGDNFAAELKTATGNDPVYRDSTYYDLAMIEMLA